MYLENICRFQKGIDEVYGQPTNQKEDGRVWRGKIIGMSGTSTVTIREALCEVWKLCQGCRKDYFFNITKIRIFFFFKTQEWQDGGRGRKWLKPMKASIG